MKRELAFALETQCELTTSGLGRTRGSKARIPSGDLSNGVSDGGGRSRKKNKAESNGPVAIDVDQEEKVTGSDFSDVNVYRRTRRYKESVIKDKSKCNVDEGLGKEELGDGSEKNCVSNGGSEAVPMAVETVSIDKTKCNLDEALINEELRDGCEKSEGGFEVVPIAVGDSKEVKNVEDNEAIKNNEVANDVNNGVKKLILVEAPRRITRSTMNSEASSSENGRVLSAEANGSSVVCASGTETKELEMIISEKKVSPSRSIPTTVKELLSTGLLEGYPVFYNRGNKVDLLTLFFIFHWTCLEMYLLRVTEKHMHARDTMFVFASLCIYVMGLGFARIAIIGISDGGYRKGFTGNTLLFKVV